MNVLSKQSLVRRIGALALAVLLMISPLCTLVRARAAEYMPAVYFSLVWEGGESVSSEIAASGYDGSQWLYLPQSALAGDVRLFVHDTYGQYARFGLSGFGDLWPDGTPLSWISYTDAGATAGSDYLDVYAYNANGQVAAQFRLYISTQADTPAALAAPVDVMVYYRDASGFDLIPAQRQTCQPGDTAIYAIPMDGYTVDADMQYVYVDAWGANPAQVVFTYTRIVTEAPVTEVPVTEPPVTEAPVTEIPILPVDVTIYYRDANGFDIIPAQTQTCQPGDTAIYAIPLDGYTVDTDMQYVYVDAWGANPAQVVFTYTQIVTEAPVTEVPVLPVDVTIYYRDTNGFDLIPAQTQTCQPGDTAIYAIPLDGYTVDTDMQYVYVDAWGANPAQVVFTYTQIVTEPPVTEVPVLPVDVTIYYRDTNGFDLIPAQTQTCQPGDTAIYAIPLDGYTLDTDMQYVYVDAWGANPAQVVFTYTQIVTEAPILPVDVTVYYRDTNGLDLLPAQTQTCQPGDTAIYAIPLDGYTVDTDMQYVYVDAWGANPAQVVFTYTQIVTEPPVTEVPVLPVDVTIYYRDANGFDLIPAQTQTCQPGDTAIYAIPLDGYTVDTDMQYVYVDAWGANPAQVVFTYTQIVTEPPVTEVPVLPVDVTIYYRDTNGFDLIPAQTQTCQPGDTAIYAIPLDGYTVDTDMQYVYVDAWGANPTQVVFTYTQIITEAPVTEVPVTEPPVTEVPVLPVDVTIYYRDTNGFDLIPAQTQTCQPGDTAIYAIPLDGYTVDTDMQYVYVDAWGANPAQVVFTYTQIITEAPVTEIPVTEPPVTEPPVTEIPILPVDVTIYYRDANGFDLIPAQTQTCQPGDTAIYAIPLDGYTVDTDMQYVYVDAWGANPAQVVFTYTQIVTEAPVTEIPVTEPPVTEPPVTEAPVTEIPILPVDVTIYYRDANGFDLIPAQTQTCQPGDTAIYAIPLDGYTVDTDMQYVYVDAWGANPAQVVFTYTQIITEAPVTEVPVTEPPATPIIVETAVPVSYIDHTGALITETTAAVNTGENYVQAASDLVPATYAQYGETAVRVVVDENGVCTPAHVEFTFIAPVEVAVHYRDAAGVPVADSQLRRCVAGTNPISAEPQNLLPNYVLRDDAIKYVIVDQNGADMPEVVFTYQMEEITPPPVTPSPEPQLVLVPVYYRTTTGGQPFYVDNTVTCFTGENVVEPNPAYVPAGYKIEGPARVTVVVDQNGAASPAVVEFTYNASDITRTVNVYYRNAQGQDVASAQGVSVGVGNRPIIAAPADLIAGYRLVGADTVYVTLLEDGTLTPEYVIFTYELAPTEQPTVAPSSYPIYDLDTYCYPKANNIPLYTVPSNDTDQNIIRMVQQNELGHIEGYVINSQNETWYLVTYNGQTGYMRDSRVRLLSNEEIAALFGYTAPPTQYISPVETPIPDGAFIDRWGTLTGNQVHFRESAGKQSGSMGRFSKGQKIFIYDSVTVDGEKWYRANLNGRDGYIMASFIALMDQGESDAYQATLPAPMPVRTPIPTAAPATPVPVTPVPATEIPVTPTPTPAPYTGYALTTRAVDLRTGVTIGDTTLATLPAGTLLYLYGQAYISDVCWNSAEVLGQGISGYVQNDFLRRISPEEAAPYLAALQPQRTDVPLPTLEPEPYSGYAVTKGGNVMIRNYADEKAAIAQVLGEGEVLWVMAQEYVPGSDYYWEIVQFGKIFGYVRNDQLRVMTPEEMAEYEKNLRTPIPSPDATITPPPITQGSMSSYGYVTTNNVRLRNGAGTQSTQIRMMSQYAFALVLGEEVVNGQTWYHINQAGTEGYVMGDYFKVLSLGELSEFLTSDEYRQSSANSEANTSYSSAGTGITSVEDFNSGVWKNPALINVTYEPFSNIIASPTPDVEQLPTVSPSPTPTATPTSAVMPTTNFTAFTTPAPNAGGGGSGWLWVGLAAAAVAIGGGAYGYSIHRANQRRAAQRAAQRRQAQQQAQRMSASGYARPTTQQPAQTTQQTTVFTPPTPHQGTPAAGAQQSPPAASEQGAVRRRRSDKHQS